MAWTQEQREAAAKRMKERWNNQAFREAHKRGIEKRKQNQQPTQQ